MLSISRSLQDHFGAKMSSKSVKFEPDGDVNSTYVLFRDERVKLQNVERNVFKWQNHWVHIL